MKALVSFAQVQQESDIFAKVPCYKKITTKNIKHEPKSYYSFDITPYIFLKGRGTKSRIELRGGRSRNEGNVFVDGKPVCDDMWDENDAIVACRMLG